MNARTDRWQHKWTTARPVRLRSCICRCGVTRVEVIVALVVFLVVGTVVSPAVLSQRERSRLSTCANNLRAIGNALHEYHSTHQSLPVAAVWRGDNLRTTMLNEVKQIDLITYQNWAQLLLPHLGRTDIASQFDVTQPVMAEANAAARLTRMNLMSCPTDHWNRDDNPYSFQPSADRDPVAELARGNYAINGGTHSHRFHPESAAQPRFDGLQLIIEENPRRFELIGTGIAGINHAFRLDEFQNGQSTLVAVEEIRAGIHSLDPRGVWSLGQVGGSITWAHGVSSDDCGPNNQWDRADDILGCGRLHEVVGGETLTEEKMPCVSYVDRNDQATARSLHTGGVNVLFLDGTVRFVNDRVDRSLWHVMHSRTTPADVLAERMEHRLNEKHPPTEAPSASMLAPLEKPGTVLTNSIGMTFVVLPAGTYTMGLPDLLVPEVPETPSHSVEISQHFQIGQFEVTQSQYQQVMGQNPSYHTPALAGVDRAEEYPVETVSWNDAVEFCRRLSDRPDERAAGRVYRLPTEAEWEYACRSGSTDPFDWSASRKKDDESGANSGMHPSLPIRPVGSYLPNAFNLYDMRGNVWEWTNDWFDRYYYGRSPVKDPQGPAEGFVKVVRGADWTFVGEPCRINYPMMPPWVTSRYVGFRVVCDRVK
jgi:prepilin-type processing-associated H-X9-DG protein